MTCLVADKRHWLAQAGNALVGETLLMLILTMLSADSAWLVADLEALPIGSRESLERRRMTVGS